MKYIDIGKVEIYLKGKCGGSGCDSCDCDVIMYEDAKVYTSGENYIIMTTDGIDGDMVIETFEFNKVKTVKINQNGITSKTD
jgi:hypothetical protein